MAVSNGSEEISGAKLTALDTLDPSKLPSEFRLFSFGENPTSKGTFTLDADGANEVMSAYAKRGVELAIDYEHDTFNDKLSGPRPAAGWMVPEVRADGLWATNVRWTPPAASALRNREYRYTSPTFRHKDGRVVELLPVALTNFPATRNAAPLVAAKDHTAIKTEPKELPMGLAAMVGLKDDAGDDEVQSRVAALVDNERKILEQTGKSSIGDALAVFLAAGAAVKERDELRAKIGEWETKFLRDEQESKERQIVALVDGAVADGRVGRDNEELLAKLKKQGDDFGVESLKFAIGLLPKRPARVFQAGPVADPMKAQMAAIDAFKREHKDATAGDAVMALSVSHPALFANTGKE